MRGVLAVRLCSTRTHSFAHSPTGPPFLCQWCFCWGNVTLTSGPVSRDGNPTQPPQATTHTCKHTRRTAKAAHLRVKPAPDGQASVGLCCSSINDGSNIFRPQIIQLVYGVDGSHQLTAEKLISFKTEAEWHRLPAPVQIRWFCEGDETVKL